jgi:hypothetical protein
MLLSDTMKDDIGMYPGDGVVGQERPTWYEVGKLRVESGSLDIADLPLIEGVRITVPDGLYVVEARLIDFAGSLCLSRLRIRLDGVAAILGPKRGDLPIDLAHCHIADFQTMRNGLTADELDELNELALSFADVFCDLCSLNFETKSVAFVVCKTGFGDGTYSVYALRDQYRDVGLEVEFIKNGHVLNRGR